MLETLVCRHLLELRNAPPDALSALSGLYYLGHTSQSQLSQSFSGLEIWSRVPSQAVDEPITT